GTAVVLAVRDSNSAQRLNTHPTPGKPPVGTSTPAPANMALVAYTSCDSLLAGLRGHTAAQVGPYGLAGGSMGYGVASGAALRGPVAAIPASAAANGAGSATSAPDHSGTNVQEVGVGEPDVVETDGRRIVSISNAVLRIVDVPEHKITGTLDLSMYAGAQSAELLMSGSRVLVLLGNDYSGGPVVYAYPRMSGTGSTFLLVDIAGPARVLDTLHTSGGYVDARMVGHTARLVVQSGPQLSFPMLPDRSTNEQRTARNRSIVSHAPLSAWQPTFSVTSAGGATEQSVPCTSVRHPAHYTGTSMLTVFTVDLTGDLQDTEPISVAADGATVYASATSLYVAGPQYGARSAATQLHRFDISGSGKPRYVGSGRVPGTLLNSYSMSEYADTLRVVTTHWPGYFGGPVPMPMPVDAPTTSAAGGSGVMSGAPTSGGSNDTSVYTLDPKTLAVEGHVGGLGRGEQVHAVRFLGPLGYVVTFRSVDPLYVVDLHDPAHPRTAGELTITGYSDYLHPLPDGRLLGVGQNVDSASRVTGLQVSLFDVTNPAEPTRLARVTRAHSPSETPIDPHAFLYWPATSLAVVPIDSWDPAQSGAAIAIHVGAHDLSVLGIVRNPAVTTTGGYNSGISRTLVIGDQLWTMSSSGLQADDIASLQREAWVAFR
ncbi:MAG TPA: beta-propeller domain-containing protein, partial [Jatrophihabitans sp.]|nr:beta-propeller domain-containing protein [Jatrophihabitans sp.]